MEKKYLIAIDPGTTESGICVLRIEDSRPLEFYKIENTDFEGWIVKALDKHEIQTSDCEAVIERMQGRYSCGVGAETFLSCEWIGRFDVILSRVWGIPVSYILRSEEYKYLCGKIYPHSDKGVKAALVDMFAFGKPNYGKGTKKIPGWFYGFYADVWQAYGQGIAHIIRSDDHVKNFIMEKS